MSLLATVNARGLLSGRPAAAAANEAYVYYATDTGILYRSNGSSWDTNSAGFANPMTTSQDVIVGGASGAPGRLAIGGAGGALSSLNGSAAYASGTSNPTGVQHDRYWRRDLDMEVMYDGTRWVSAELRRETFGFGGNVFPITASPNVAGYFPMWHTEYDLWVVAIYVTTYVATTNDGSKFWTVDAQKMTAGAAATSIGSFTTAADTVDNFVTHKITVGASIVQGTNKLIQLSLTKTSTPGGIYVSGAIAYRLIVT